MKNIILFTLVLFLFSSCNQSGSEKETGSKNVSIKTGGIFKPVEYEIIGGLDRGEYLIGSDADVYTISLKNNSNFSLTDVNLELDSSSTAGMKFNPNEEGKAVFPGYLGTCSDVLGAGQACTFKIYYKPTLPGNLKQKIKLTYKNLIESNEIVKELSLVAGEAASLIYTSEKINYSFGVVERTERTVFEEVLIIKNTGGLTARNVTMSQFDVPNTAAYKILDNTCAITLAPKASCQFKVTFESMNYSGAAPDGAADVTYTSNIKFDYIRDPDGGTGSLNAYFGTLSTTIEGKIKVSGVSGVEFENIVVGNIAESLIKIQNQGHKEAILKQIDLRDSSNTKIATCVRVSGTSELECRDPSDPTNPLATLPITTIPFYIEDISSCFSNYDKMSYTRLSDGSLSDSTITTVAGLRDELPGDACFFRLKFHPSVTFLADGNFNDWRINVVFDSTWKNDIVMYNFRDSDQNDFNFTKAEYTAAAKLEIDTFDYASAPFPNLDVVDNGEYLYDLGRVSLVTSSSYKQPLKFKVKNRGGYLAEIDSLTDGASTPFVITDSSQALNSFYQNVSHTNCTVLGENGGECEVRMEIAALASSNSDSLLAQNEENANMYDEIGPYPDRYKKFKFSYKDGSTINDDKSPRANREMEVSIRSLLVRKGYLVFEDVSSIQGILQQKVAGNVEFKHVLLKNVGTGGIPYIDMPAGNALEGTSEKSGGVAFPYEIVDRPYGEDGATKDCFDIISIASASMPVGVTPGTNAPSILDAGESCSLSVKMKIRSTDITPSYFYTIANPEWNRRFSFADNNTIDAWEPVWMSNNSQDITFDYYDGDGIADLSNGYSPDLSGYGNSNVIGGGNSGEYRIGLESKTQAKLIPDKPLPMIGAILYRPQIDLPSITPTGTEWGATIAADTIVAQYMDLSKGDGFAPISYWNNSKTHIQNNFLLSNYDYIYHAGTFKAGETYTTRFSLRNAGQSPATSLIESFVGDAEIVKVTSSGTSLSGEVAIDLNFSPSSSGTYSTEYEITYKNSRRTLTDESTLTYSDDTSTFKMLIVFEAVSSTAGDIKVESQDYLIDYDPVGPVFVETLDPAVDLYNPLTVGFDSGNFATFRAIKGSAVYFKKIFTVTNTGTSDINDVFFNIKASLESFSPANTSPGLGYIIENNGCTGITLAASAQCTFEVKLDASDSEPEEHFKYGVVSYSLAPNQYTSKSFQMQFLASDPALLSISGINPMNITDEHGGVIQDSYGINFGYYHEGSHPVMSTGSTISIIKNSIQIVNNSAEKASLLSQYRDYVGNNSATIPGTLAIRIYNTNGITVDANRACFYGDDEGSGIDPDKWGFNVDSLAPCLIDIEYTFDETFLGEKLPTESNYVPVSFYNSERASTDLLYLHMEGFLEPNRSIAPTDLIKTVQSSSDGTVSFSWDDFSPDSALWGVIDKYRVYYSANPIALNNIYDSTGLSFEETATPDVVITSLTPGTYYYFKITTIRTSPGGKEFISMAPGMSMKEVVVPPSGSFYNYDLGVIVDEELSPEGAARFGTKDQVAAGCAVETFDLLKGGGSVLLNKELINSSVYALIDATPSQSPYPYHSIPHWLNDSPTDIAPVFGGTFNCSETNGSTVDNMIFYKKSCGDCSCNSLSIMRGGDGDSLPPRATMYVEGSSFSGAQRCFAFQ